MRQDVSRALVGVLIACSVAIVSLLDQKRRAKTHLGEARRQLEAEKRNRAAERTGRIRAEAPHMPHPAYPRLEVTHMFLLTLK